MNGADRPIDKLRKESHPPLTIPVERWNEAGRSWEVHYVPNPAIQDWKLGVLMRAGWTAAEAFRSAPLIKGFAYSESHAHNIRIIWRDGLAFNS